MLTPLTDWQSMQLRLDQGNGLGIPRDLVEQLPLSLHLGNKRGKSKTSRGQGDEKSREGDNPRCLFSLSVSAVHPFILSCRGTYGKARWRTPNDRSGTYPFSPPHASRHALALESNQESPPSQDAIRLQTDIHRNSSDQPGIRALPKTTRPLQTNAGKPGQPEPIRTEYQTSESSLTLQSNLSQL
jgi:hypothetical protein